MTKRKYPSFYHMYNTHSILHLNIKQHYSGLSINRINKKKVCSLFENCQFLPNLKRENENKNEHLSK